MQDSYISRLLCAAKALCWLQNLTGRRDLYGQPKLAIAAKPDRHDLYGKPKLAIAVNQSWLLLQNLTRVIFMVNQSWLLL